MTAGPPSTSYEYETLRESLSASGASFALPELHGGVSGALCGGGPAAAERWIDEFFADHEARNVPVVHELVSATWQALAGEELAFAPLLPDDDAPLEDQVRALALWCHGFVNGLSASAPDVARRATERAGPKEPRHASSGRDAEVAEILHDFAEISRAGVDDADAADRDSADFALAEIKEYARVSAQIVFENLAERRAAAARETH